MLILDLRFTRSNDVRWVENQNNKRINFIQFSYTESYQGNEVSDSQSQTTDDTKEERDKAQVNSQVAGGEEKESGDKVPDELNKNTVIPLCHTPPLPSLNTEIS